MTRVLHTGDTHVGYQQYHEPERRADFLAGFETVVDDAVEADVDAVVHAGDLFHDRRPDLQDLQGVVGALRRLRAAEIPFLAIVGNHEAKRSGQWLDLFADLDLAERLGPEPRRVGDLALYGLDFVPASRRDDLDYEFADHDADCAALVAHGLFEPFDPGEWDTAGLLEAASVDFDAMLLGDNHDPGTQQVGDTWVTYPGSTERASAAERVDRGYNLVTVEDGDCRIARRTIETREFVFVDVELAPGEGGDVVRDRVREHDHEDAVTVVTVEGAGEPITPGPIEELALDRGALVARVNDRRDVETPDEAAADVHFADPDEAVRERLRERGFSEAALDLDRVIRDDGVADSNVRDTVRRRVEERRDDGLDGFEPVPEDEIDDSAGAEEDADGGDGATGEDDGDVAANGTDEPDGADEEDGGAADGQSDAVAVAATDAEDSAQRTEATPAEDESDGAGGVAADDGTVTDDGAAADDGEKTDAGDAPDGDADGQASMEEYL